MKQSVAFAAFRQSIITDLNHAVLNDLVPEFNSRCEDIRRRVEEDRLTYHNEAKSSNLRKTLVYDAVLARQQVLDQIQSELQTKIMDRLVADNAEIREEEVPDPKKPNRMKKIITAMFPDKSSARVPSSLWIDFSAFDRV